MVNFQSLANKKLEFEYMLQSTGADIVLGTESWLDETISDNEIFPEVYVVLRKDRNRRGWGVYCSQEGLIVGSTV